MYKVESSDFFQFIKENENAKKELMESLEKHNLLSLEKNKQENVMLDAMIKLAKKYNFDIGKSDLKKSLNEGVVELDDDQLLNVAGGFGLLPWGLLLLQLFSSGGSAVSTFFSSKSTEPTTKTAIVQSYDEREETDLSDLKFSFKDNDDNSDTNDNTPSDDIDLGTPNAEVQQNDENKIDDNEPNNEANTDLPEVDVQQSAENKTDDNASGSDNIIADVSNDVEDDQDIENEAEVTNDTTEAEINFSLKLLESLPKEGEPDFDDFLRLPSVEDLEENREVTIRHKDGSTETININEKEVYKDIENIVREIVHKVESRTPEENMSQEDIDLKINNKEISKHYKLPKQMRIAKAIYRWVAKNITYDQESNEKDSNGEKLRKPQNALFVFNQKSGVCAGYASLTNLMMRIAGVHSGAVASSNGPSGGLHAYNVIYLEDTATNRKGWTLIDSTWAAPMSDRDSKTTDSTSEETTKLSEEILINSNMNCLAEAFNDDSNDLSSSIYEQLEAVNAAKDPEKMDRAEEYIARVQAIVASIIQKYSDNISDNVDNINVEIQAGLDKINPDYQDVVTFKEFKVFSETDEEIGRTNFAISAATSLDHNEAKSLAKTQIEADALNIHALSSMKMFFPGFYDINKDFTEANKAILSERTHKIDFVGNRSAGEDYEAKRYKVEVGGVKYELRGNEGNAYIEMSGDRDNPIENVQIPSDLANLGMKFVIYKGIKSITLTGNETIDVASISDLENINTENSNKYIAEDGILYAKKADGSKGKALDLFKWSGDIDGIHYYTNKDSNNKLASIEICNYKGDDFASVTLPEQLTQFNVPIKIGHGIKSITLTGNQTIDTSDLHLDEINTENSNKYIAENGTLYEKSADGSKGDILAHFKTN